MAVPPDKPVRFVHPALGQSVVGQYPTPLIEDLVIIVAKAINAPGGYKVEPYGTPHPDSDKYPNHKLALVQFSEDGLKAKLFFVADRDDQDLYNWSQKFSSEDHGAPIYVRQYVLPREDYEPLDNGTPDSANEDALSIHEEVLGPADGELASLYVKVVRVFETLPGPFVASTRIDPDSVVVTVNTRRNVAADITSSEAVAGGVWTKTTKKGGDTYVAEEVVETRAIPGNAVVSTEFERDGVTKTVSRQLVATADVITTETLATNLLTRKYGEAVTKLVSRQIIETIAVTSESLLDLASLTTSIPNVIPEIFRALIPTHVESHIVRGAPAEPDLILGEFEHSERALTPLYKEVRSTILDDIGDLPITITGLKETNDKKQVVSVTMTLELDNTTPTVPTATRDVDFKKLGNGLAVEVVRTVPDVFPEDSYTKSILNLVPEKFRAAIPLVETTIDSVGQPSTDPTLLTGEFSRTEGRLTEFTKRVRVTKLATVSLPVIITGNKETDSKKQVVSVTYTLEVDSTTPTAPSEVRDVEFVKLGNGLAVETVRTVPTVFPEDSYTKSIENLIPAKLRSGIPIVESTIDEAGAPSTNPTLLTGELSRTEGRLTEFTRRIRITKLGAITPPVVIFEIKTSSIHGGGDILTSYTLNTSLSMTLDEGLLFVESNIVQLGNGYDIKTTSVLVNATAWPTLIGSSFDKEMQVRVIEEQQTVDPSYTRAAGDYFVENVRPIDRWKSERTRITKVPAALQSTIFGPFQFPGLLGTTTGFSWTGTPLYTYKRASARLVKHEILTTWVSSPTKPGASFSEIITDSAIMPTLSGGFEWVHDVLHDGYFQGTYYFPPTTPTYTEYAHGSIIGYDLQAYATLSSPGSGYAVGQTVSFGGNGATATIRVTSVGISNSIAGFTTISAHAPGAGTFGPFGSSASFYIVGVNLPRYNGNGWIGTPRVIAAIIEPTDIPNLWKIETKSVVMR